MAKRTGLSNLELAGNPTWVVASAFMECPFCGLLARGLGLDRLSVPCPRCGRSGSARSVFPDYACLQWLEMIGEAYARAHARARGRLDELTRVIGSDLKRDVEAPRVAAAASDVRRFFRKSHRTDSAYQEALAALEGRLSLDSQEQAARVFSLLANHSDTSIEHTFVVVLTASLLERLLHDLLVRLLVGRGMSEREARRTLRGKPRREQLQELFWVVTGTRLEKALGEYGVPGLYEEWQSIADRRNKFLHITSAAISADMAEKAFNIAKHAFPLFALLQNKYCPANTPRTSD